MELLAFISAGCAFVALGMSFNLAQEVKTLRAELKKCCNFLSDVAAQIVENEK